MHLITLLNLVIKFNSLQVIGIIYDITCCSQMRVCIFFYTNSRPFLYCYHILSVTETIQLQEGTITGMPGPEPHGELGD